MRLILSLCTLAACLTPQVSAQQTGVKTSEVSPNERRFTAEQPALLPHPQELKWGNQSSELKLVSVNFDHAYKKHERLTFTQKEIEEFFKAHSIKKSKDAKFALSFVAGQPELPNDAKDWQKEEAYTLKVNKNGITITASDMRGFYNGLQTLKQLIVRRDGKTTIAHCEITDWPDLQIRGFMNDVGRNYMPVELLKEEIDIMALLKFNVFHFHFTENHGWRLESKIYPEVNAPEHFNRMPGKFYTQAEFVELVNYCRERNILLIPEMDMPGHTECFRKALGLEKMQDERATEALEKLLEEMMALVPADKMPYIHIGTDEAKGHEQVDSDTLMRYFATVEKAGRKPIRWQPGLNPKGYTGAIEQLWTERQLKRSWPSKGAKYIDSHETYLNHQDPFTVAQTMYFRRPCPFTHAEGIGFILCSWPDLPIADPRNQVLQTPVYQGLAFIAEPLWNNPHPKLEGDVMKDELGPYMNGLPPVGSPLLEQFKEHEDRVLAIRDRFMSDREFTYVRQTEMQWNIIGPFPHGGDVKMEFGPEAIAKGEKPAESYTHDGKEYKWHDDVYPGATIIFKHYCDNPTLFTTGGWPGKYEKNSTYYAMQYIYSPKEEDVSFWISGHTWATSDWRNGPVSVKGKWFHAEPKFWVNGQEIAAPEWKKPGNADGLVDENYQFRAATMIPLKKGWNQVLVKSPNNNGTRRWMFTFAPVKIDLTAPMGQNIKEYPGLKFSHTLPKK